MAIKTTTNGPKQPLATGETAAVANAQQMRALGERASSGNGPTFGPLEPCMWITTADVAHKTGPHTFKGNNARRINGKVERRPSVAHTGECDYLDRKVHPRAQSRYRMMLDTTGNVCAIVHSNAAAHLPVIEHGRYSRDGYAQHVINKGFALGWIDVNAGCLKRQVADGLVSAAALVVDISKAHVCGKDVATCKHIAAEQSARQAKQAAAMAELERRATPPDPSVAIGLAVARALAADRAARGEK